MQGARRWHLLPLLLLAGACADAPQDEPAAELRAFLRGDQPLSPGDAPRLNAAFARESARAAGYAREGAEAPADEAWTPVARRQRASEAALDVRPWLDAGDIAPDGSFAPCARSACPRVDPDEVARSWPRDLDRPDERAQRLAGAARRLAGDDVAIAWNPALERALLLDADARRVEIHPRLIELIAPEPPPAAAPGSLPAAPAAQPATRPSQPPQPAAPGLRAAGAPVNWNHEPPPSEKRDDCNCDSCSSKDTSCAVAPRTGPPSAGLVALALLALLLRRRCAQGSRTPSRLERLLGALLPAAALWLAPNEARAQGPAPAGDATQARIEVRGFAPDAVIAVDGAPVGTGYWIAPVAPGPHLVQVYKPGGPAYTFQVVAVAGQTAPVPPPPMPGAAMAWPPPPPEPPPPPPAPSYQFVTGGYLVGQLGFAAITSKPEGFRYSKVTDSDTGQPREGSGIGFTLGGTGGMRLTRGVGIGGMLLYANAGGSGTLDQIKRVPGSGQILTHSGDAKFRHQSLRVGPAFRFMAGGDRARFLAGITFGASYSWLDLDHPDVTVKNGAAVQVGTFHHDYSGMNPYFGFDLGAEFNPGNTVLLGFALDVLLDRTGGIQDNPLDSGLQGYVGMSARLGFHRWVPR